MDGYTPYCGTPPVPAEIWTRWTLEPSLLIGAVLALALGLWQARDQRALAGGWALAVLLFVSPLCAASMALFSARVAQHLLLVLVAAPLLATGLKGRGLPPGPAAGLFAGLFWFWHVPGPYGWTLAGDAAYWAMHLSVLGSAVLFWQGIGAWLRARPFACYLALAGTGAQMTLLSVLLVVSSRLWHPWHLVTTDPWGLAPMQDQAAAGALMWVAGGLLMAGAVALVAARLLRAPDTATG